MGPVACEPNGSINLNRYLRFADRTEATLTHGLTVPTSGRVRLSLGFSDELVLEADGQDVLCGTCTFSGFADRAARGYVELGRHQVTLALSPGVHQLTARVRATEPFGWGLVAAVQA